MSNMQLWQWREAGVPPSGRIQKEHSRITIQRSKFYNARSATLWQKCTQSQLTILRDRTNKNTSYKIKKSNKWLQLPGSNLPVLHTVDQPFIQAKSKQIPHERHDQNPGATTTGVPAYWKKTERLSWWKFNLKWRRGLPKGPGLPTVEEGPKPLNGNKTHKSLLFLSRRLSVWLYLLS